MSYSDSHAIKTSHTCKSCTIYKNKKPFKTRRFEKRKTRASKMEAKKVNNMPNLQSMSQAKGYGRLHKKSSETQCFDEIDRTSFLTRSDLQSFYLDVESNIVWWLLDMSSIVHTLGCSDNRFCLFLFSHVASQSWTICDTCVGFRLLHNNDCLFKVSHIL